MYVDPRGLRFGAWITVAVLALAILTGSAWILAFQAAVFAVGALVGPAATPYAVLFRRLVAPRIGRPSELEAAGPPRFAQSVGLVFALVGLTGLALGADVIAALAVGASLGAAFLNAAFGFCLGCEMYVVVRRMLPAESSATHR